MQYSFSYNYDAAGAQDPRIESVLPPDMAWTVVPTGCTGTGGTPVPTGIYDSVSGEPGGDGRRLVCQLPSTGTSLTGSVTAVARVGIDNPHGTVNQVGFTLSDGAGTSVVSNTVEVTTSSRAAYNLIKRSVGGVAAVGPDGTTPGLVRTYTFSIVLSHPTRTGSQRLKGQARLEPTITFVDSLASFSPHARLYDWGGNQYTDCAPIAGEGAVPNSAIDPGRGFTAANSVPNTGAISCAPGSPGGQFTVTLSGTDTSGSSFPSTNANGSGVGSQLYVATGRVPIWLPYSDVLNGDDGVPGTADDGTLRTVNTFTEFSPTDLNGQQNVPEPLADNSSVVNLVSGFSASKSYRDYGSPTAVPEGATGFLSGDLIASPGYRVRSLVNFVPQITPAPTAIVCDVFDSSAQRLVLGPDGGGPAVKRTDGTPAASTVVEYGAAPVKPTTFDEMRDARCGDDDAVWSTDPSDPALGGTVGPHGFRTSIDRVRLRANVDLPADRTNWLTTYLELYGTSSLDPARNPGGVITPNYGQIRLGDTWHANVFDPIGGRGNFGDRINVASGVVRVDKETVPYAPGTGESAPPGVDMAFRLSPSATTPGSGVPGEVGDVVVTDVLPVTEPRLTVNPWSASTGPGIDSVEFCAVCDGSDWSSSPASVSHGVRWVLGDRAVGEPIEPLEFSVRVPVTAPQGTAYTNTAVVSSPSDPSSVARRSASSGIQVETPSTLLVTKTVADPLLPAEGLASWSIVVQNAMTTDVVRLDVVDVLPHRTDGRSPGSDFGGSLALAEVGGLPGGMTAYVTDASPEALDAADGTVDGYADPGNPGDPWFVAPGTGTWRCPLDQVDVPGCPAARDVTAVRFVTPVDATDVLLPAGESLSWDVRLQTSGNASGDVYTNRYLARTDPVALPLPALSPDVPVVVVTPAVEIVKRVCTAPEASECDPGAEAWADDRALHPGDTAVFLLTATNRGPIDGVAVVGDPLPEGLEFVEGSAHASVGDVTRFPEAWDVGTLTPGESQWVTFSAVVGGSDAGTPIVNTADVALTDRFGQGAVDDDPARVRLLLPDLAVDKTVVANASTATALDVTYRIDVTNEGGAAGEYDLDDVLVPGDGVVPTGATVVEAPVPVDPGWDGIETPRLVSGVPLVEGGVHTYVVRVVGTVSTEAGRSCPEGGAGNRAVLVSEGSRVVDEACADVPPPLVEPSDPAPSETVAPPVSGQGAGAGRETPWLLPRTGAVVTSLIVVAALLLGVGGVLAGRRRRPSVDGA